MDRFNRDLRGRGDEGCWMAGEKVRRNQGWIEALRVNNSRDFSGSKGWKIGDSFDKIYDRRGRSI